MWSEIYLVHVESTLLFLHTLLIMFAHFLNVLNKISGHIVHIAPLMSSELCFRE